MSFNELGQSIPPDTAHAVSVSLPTWKSNVGYEEGEEWVLSKMKTGYPRYEFYIHQCIANFADTITACHGKAEERAMVFPSHCVASRFVDFLKSHGPSLRPSEVRIVELVPSPHPKNGIMNMETLAKIYAALFPEHLFKLAKSFWQHSGEGVSSRQAEFAHRAYEEGALSERKLAPAGANNDSRPCKGPRRYQRGASTDKTVAQPIAGRAPTQTYLEPEANGTFEGREYSQFIEERFGRNLDLSFVQNAKLAIRRRIAGSLTADVDLKEAINTLKILQKWGPGCLFYGHGSSQDLDDLEGRLKRGDRYLALFCEFPSNPLLKSPDIERIRLLADKYGFAVVVDETIGNFMNVHVLPFADAVVSSLTKVFSGDSNVMGGSCVLNPGSPLYTLLKDTLAAEYEDNYWAEDAIFMERNSRDFVSRIDRINVNAEAICDVLKAHRRVKEVHYPKCSPTRSCYERCRNPNGGYGGLLSVTFFSTPETVTFFDRLETAKGPSLGTNFTLCCPFTLLAHYGELEWASQFGVEADLIRISVGLEETSELVMRFERALEAIACLVIE
ncbi:hypothetical protein FGG08_001761 [Glutinoglossum americanum]|uniref:Cystathionine gamma-synthase n=1 Tax=Glutinoglossum americanum TaxID=1670608 RepID=A0A9P8KZX2_9PEZI|nr:hypothetical protein FGG08_001761 [Glutinoglossum americanum]